MEFRKIFDTIPNQFDKYRPRYSAELFADLIAYADVGAGKAVLELGPGTGQATEPILKTGCDYLAIELGEHLAAKMCENFAPYSNFSLICKATSSKSLSTKSTETKPSFCSCICSTIFLNCLFTRQNFTLRKKTAIKSLTMPRL